jgi:hypothetical protein
MKLIKCDNHPDRDVVATFRIIELAAGARPIFIGYSTGAHTLLDLCEECATRVRALKEK